MRLVHAEAGARIVEAQAVEGGSVLGSALGEAPSAEEAEERARRRLQAQLEAPPGVTREGGGPGDRRSREPVQLPTRTAPAPAPAPASAPTSTPASAPPPAPSEEPPGDPEDWSSELARIDLQLQRLGWQRPQESAYLERAFGHGSRSRITTYADLLAYLRTLETLEPGCDPDSVPVPLRRRDLLTQSDALLAQLGWSAGQGRQFLEQHLGLASRQQLSDPQLLQFNMLLEEAVLGSGSPELPPG